MTWRLAKSLEKLRSQLNEAHPSRSTVSDGGIGDAAHQAEGSASDHNPWFNDNNGVGVVTAFDFTHDPANGMDIGELSDILTEGRDPRIKYMIANGLILIPNKLDWASDFGWHWQQYSGDPHTSHLHLSVNTTSYDNEADWNIGEGEEMVTNETAYLAFNGIRMRPPTKDELDQFVGKWTLESLVKALSEGTEREKVVSDWRVGRQATNDNWAGQIHTLVSEVQKKVTDSDAVKKLEQIKSIVK